MLSPAPIPFGWNSFNVSHSVSNGLLLYPPVGIFWTPTHVSHQQPPEREVPPPNVIVPSWQEYLDAEDGYLGRSRVSNAPLTAPGPIFLDAPGILSTCFHTDPLSQEITTKTKSFKATAW